MSITLRASAPGKLLLLGEYAVLEGAPALVMAVNRRALAELESGDADAGGACSVHAPDVHPERVHFTLGKEGRPHWREASPEAPSRLALVSHVLRALAARGLLPEQGFHLRLDSSAFFESAGPGVMPAKLGLGSSAAMTTALASLLTAFAGARARCDDRARWLATLLEIHREFQSGRGSGVDVAASLYGGTIRYRLDGGAPVAAAVNWPESLQKIWVWSGQSASTADFLTMLADWRERHPQAYARRMAALRETAEEGVRAIAAGDAAALQNRLAEAGRDLHLLGEASKIPIFSAAHRRIADQVEAAGGSYKPCGAGGGDLGLAVAADDAIAERVRARLTAAGHVVLALDVEDAGLVIQRKDATDAN